MNTEKQIKYQIGTRKLDSNRYKRKNITKQNSNRINKNKKINKQDCCINDQYKKRYINRNELNLKN